MANKELVEYEIQEVALFTTSVVFFFSFQKFFVLVSSNFLLSKVDKISQARARVVFRRRMEYHLSNTIAPTFLLMLVGYLSFFFNVDDFTDRIMVALTSTLVIATLMSSIAEVRHLKLNLFFQFWSTYYYLTIFQNYIYYISFPGPTKNILLEIN